MTSITPELLKQRAEHNEKMLTNLEEVGIVVSIMNLRFHYTSKKSSKSKI